MTTKIKATILIGFFFFGLLTGLQAQDKYEYMMLSQVQTGSGKIYIATSTIDDYKEEVVSAKSYDMRELIKRIVEYTDKGWELYNNTYSAGYTGQNAITYFFKKKKN